jgi:hypothetical protein
VCNSHDSFCDLVRNCIFKNEINQSNKKQMIEPISDRQLEIIEAAGKILTASGM